MHAHARVLRTITATPTGCWISSLTPSQWHAKVKIAGRSAQAHRLTYAVSVGLTLAELAATGLDIDHVRARGCGGGHCVRPSHLEPVTSRENTLRGDGHAAANSRKERCREGHLLVAPNLDTYHLRRGERCCRVCRMAYRRQKKAVARSEGMTSETALSAVLAAHPELHNDVLEGSTSRV